MPPGLPMSGRGMPGLGRGAIPLALMPSGAAQSGVTAAGKARAPRGGSAAAVTGPSAPAPGTGWPVYPEPPGGAFMPAPGIFAQPGWGGPALPAMMSAGPMMPGFGPPRSHNIDVSNLYDQWLDLSTRPTLAWCDLPPGSVIEAATHDYANVVDGTALFMIREKYQPDQDGVYMEAGFLGTSNPAQSIQLSLLFDLKTNPIFCAGILHWCATGIGLCCASLPHKHVFHMPHLRFRETKRVK